jgi:NO-binding membrane sensor protein with MHYT domain
MAADKQDRLHLGLHSISFGLIAIWCMHFVGNKAIIMGGGRTEVQLSYSAGYTVLSAALPTIILYLGFSAIDRYGKTQRSLYLSLIVTGLAAGLSITCMHYVGNLGTSNYTLENDYKNVIGAAVIAVFDCWFSFTILFIRENTGSTTGGAGYYVLLFLPQRSLECTGPLRLGPAIVCEH